MLQTTPLALAACGFLLEIKRLQQRQYTWDTTNHFLGFGSKEKDAGYTGITSQNTPHPVSHIPNRARSHGYKLAPKMVVVGYHRHHHSEAELSLLRKSGVSIPHPPQHPPIHPSGPRGFSCVRLIPVPHERAGPVKDAQSGAGSALQGCRLTWSFSGDVFIFLVKCILNGGKMMILE